MTDQKPDRPAKPVITEDDGTREPAPEGWQPPTFNQSATSLASELKAADAMPPEATFRDGDSMLRWLNAAPPKPAPDAVREALNNITQRANGFVNRRTSIFSGMIVAEELQWAIGEILAALAAPAVAAEPVAFIVLSKEVDSFGYEKSRIWWRNKASADAWCAQHNATAIPLYASPTVRGDREAARDLECVLSSLMLATNDHQGNVPFVRTNLRAAFKEILQPLYAMPPAARSATERLRDAARDVALASNGRPPSPAEAEEMSRRST